MIFARLGGGRHSRSKQQQQPMRSGKTLKRRWDQAGNKATDIIIGAAIGLGVSAVALPVLLGATGFTAAGITVGSIGAKMMSAAAIANGGGVAAGSLVATLLSLGAAGAPAAVKVATAAVGAALGSLS